MSVSIYKPKQGVYARGVAAGALLLLDLLLSVRFAQMFRGGSTFRVMELSVYYSDPWAAVLFVAFAGVISVFVFGVETGLSRLDSTSRKFVDLLADTQAELQKVSWPGRQELGRSTVVVLVCVVLLGCFLYVVDTVFTMLMTRLEVLPGK